MNNQQIIEVSNQYLTSLNCISDKESEKDSETPGSIHHLKWMLSEIPTKISEGKIEKAHRWLGFIQGVLWAKGIYSIEELKNDNK